MKSLIILVSPAEELLINLVDAVLSKILLEIETSIKKFEKEGLQKKENEKMLISKAKDVVEALKMKKCMHAISF